MVWRRALIGTALVLLCALSGLAGSMLALRASTPTVDSLTLGTVAFRAKPATAGSLDVYVPIVDWGVRASPFRAPVSVQLEFRALDREAALEALRSSGAADANLGLLESELRGVVSDGLRRAAALAVVGGALGGLLGGALVAALGRRRRWLGLGALAGLAASLAAVSVAAVGLSRFDYDAFQEPTFYARGAELPRLLTFSEQLLTAGEDYTDSYDQAVAGLTNLIAVAGGKTQPLRIARTAIVASDLHSNTFALPALADYTAGKTVFLVGDYTELGTRYEEGVAAELGQLGDPVVAVSGNHDSRPFMRAAAEAGIVVLTRSGRLSGDGSTDGRPVQRIGGLSVAGYDDPLEGKGRSLERRKLELFEGRGSAYADVVAWFDGLPDRPDVVLVHQHGLAHVLLDALSRRPGAPVLVLTGHDHRQHVDQEGANVLVDGGTVGAGGPFGIGEQFAGFAQLDWGPESRLRAVDLIEVEPLSGSASARRIVLGAEPDRPVRGVAAGP